MFARLKGPGTYLADGLVAPHVPSAFRAELLSVGWFGCTLARSCPAARFRHHGAGGANREPSNPKLPLAQCSSRPNIHTASNIGLVPAPRSPPLANRSPPPSWTAIWPGPATPLNKPNNRQVRTVPTTSGGLRSKTWPRACGGAACRQSSRRGSADAVGLGLEYRGVPLLLLDLLLIGIGCQEHPRRAVDERDRRHGQQRSDHAGEDTAG